MYEEVCLLCGKPVNADGRAYCSDECESLDATSPSISTSSSAYPSPYLHSMNGPGNLADVPALVPSALGRSLNASPYKTHKNRLSVSSSSTSDFAWSTFTDDEDDDSVSPGLLSGGGEDELIHKSDLFNADVGNAKLSGSLGHILNRPTGSGLSYARRPSSTNNRSTIPLLHRRTSSIAMSSPPATGSGFPQSAPAPNSPAEDDFSDAPSASISSVSSAHSYGAHERRRTRKSRASEGNQSGEQDKEADTVTSKSGRNRASLPAYFSLLTSSTSPSSTRTQRFPSSLQTLTALTRSFQSSPPTPRVANPILDSTTTYARPSGVEATPRGRKRDPDARSTSSRRSAARSPPRQLTRDMVAAQGPSPPHRNAHIGPQARARIDSVEKVFDWVSNSPVVGTQVRGRTLTRRNSSPPPKPSLDTLLGRRESDDQFDVVREALARSLHIHHYVPDNGYESRVLRDGTRGRRRANEIDEPPMGVDNREAPGFGNGRSGLRARERGRAVVR
ncbi:hypothetical protein AcV5_006426 [Taiwanofungus camphoratus]|nr:hypothetical protein AcV5_006426 [Antrodia cinnamomea]